MNSSGLLLVATVAVVGVLHTSVPDHWMPIALLARQQGWSKAQTARAALQAGTGHVVTTLTIGIIVWAAGVAFATRFGHIVDTPASLALIGFGAWIAISSLRELCGGHGHSHHHGQHHGPSPDGIHGPELQLIDTGQGIAKLSIFEDGIPPHFRLNGLDVDRVRAETIRPKGESQQFGFANRDGYWQSIDAIPEPHDFQVKITLGYDQHDHIHTVTFAEHDHSDHGYDIGDDPLYAPYHGDVPVTTPHAHTHRHGGVVHMHWHDHAADTAHEITSQTETSPPLHAHKHQTSGHMALLLILGSSPMVEGIPAFFAASRYGITLIAVMAIVFAISTIATYVSLCVYSAAGLQRIKLGPLERYGEIISGAFIAVVGAVFWIWPVL